MQDSTKPRSTCQRVNYDCHCVHLCLATRLPDLGISQVILISPASQKRLELLQLCLILLTHLCFQCRLIIFAHHEMPHGILEHGDKADVFSIYLVSTAKVCNRIGHACCRTLAIVWMHVP